MVTLTSSQQVGIRVNPTDKKGNPAPLDGNAQFASTDDGIATVAAGSDGLSAVVKATGKIGACQIIVTGDADLGEGIQTLQGVLDVNVIAGQAASFGITTDVPTEQE